MLAFKLGLGFSKPEMMEIRAGTFWMGSKEDDPDAESDEKPQREVKVASFWIGKYEVTFDEYDLFANVTGRPKADGWGWGRGRRPVINVSWEDAVDYAKWLSEVTGQHYRLPTEAEWEYAARAGTTSRYWWGDELGDNHANCHGCGSEWDTKQTAPVGLFKANPFGLHDTAGNVWEWICSVYRKPYDGSESQCASSNEGGERVLRGGSWICDGQVLRSADRFGNDPGSRYPLHWLPPGPRSNRQPARSRARGEVIEESERCRTDRAERRRSGMARSVSWEVDDMRYRFFSIPAMMPDDMQDEMNRFCAAHRVIHIEKQFVQDGERSYWALCVGYVEKPAGPLSPRKSNVDYREVLSAADFALFAKLRDLRKKMSEQEGVPAYALFTNEQLAQMVQQRVTTKAELAALDGVGRARIEKYGEAFPHVLLSVDAQAPGTSQNGTHEASMS